MSKFTPLKPVRYYKISYNDDTDALLSFVKFSTGSNNKRLTSLTLTLSPQGAREIREELLF